MSRRHFVAVLSLVSALPSCNGSVRSRTQPDGGARSPREGAAEPARDAAVSRDSSVGPSLPDVAVIPPDRVTPPDVLPPVVPEVCTGELPVMTAMDMTTVTESAADFSCYGDAPDSGAPEDAGPSGGSAVTYRLSSLFPREFIAGVTVDFFWGGSTLGEPALTRTFQSNEVTFDTPPGVATISARVNPSERDPLSMSIVEVREFGFPVVPGGTSIEGFIAVRDSVTLTARMALDGGEADPTKAMISAIARDCRGFELRGAQFELIDGETAKPVPTGKSPGQPRSSYVYYGLPSTTCEYTTGTTGWFLIDAPVNVANGAKTHPYRLRMKGRRTAADVVPVVIGEIDVELFPGTLSYVRLYR